MSHLTQDLKFALRQLFRSPGFAITAILTLALGIGANTAIFSLLDQALLRTLPVHDPSQLVTLRDSSSAWSGSISMSGGDQNDYFSYPQYLGLRDHGKDFAGLAAVMSTQAGLTRDNKAAFVNTELVSGNYFQVLGVPALLGRTLLPSDDTAPGANPVAVVSDSFWRDKLGADPSVVGSTVSLGGRPYQIVGVSAPGFWRDKLGADPSIVGSTVTLGGRPYQIVGVSAPGFSSAVWGQSTAVFIPLSMIDTIFPGASIRYTDHTYRWLSIIGRLAPGVTPAQAQAANASFWHAMRENDLQLNGGRSQRYRTDFLASQLLLQPGARGFSFNRTALQAPFLAVMSMAVLVLLIAAVNVSSLILVRSAGRVREFSLRAALGASSARIVSQLLLEGVLVGLCGGIVGLLLAPFALRVLIGRLADSNGDTTFTAAIDHRILLFNFAVAIFVSLAFSLFPALQLRRPNLTSALRESTGTGAGNLIRMRRVVVCLQIGLSVVLLVGAGLFIRTMQQLRAVNVGFSTSHLVTFNIDPTLDGYTPAQTPAVQQRVLDGLRAIPGIEAVAASDDQALVPGGSFYGIKVTGYQPPPDETFQTNNSTVTPDYDSTMRIPLLAGRELSDTDTLDHPPVALVNRSFVKHYCNGSNQACLGQRINLNANKGTPDDQAIQIVGIVPDQRTRGIRADIVANMYRPLKQVPSRSQLYLYLRTTLPPAQFINTVRRAMQQIDPTLAIGNIHTMEQQVDTDLQNERMITLLAISFGVLAAILAGVGLYGVLAYSTAQRTREIGIRMALGSTRLGVSSLILADVLKLAALGVVIAIPVAYGLSILIRSQLFGVSAADPVILLSVVALIALVALLAGLVPARRAATIEPSQALRTE